MTTFTAPHGFNAHLPRIPRRAATLARSTATTAVRPSWMERLAAWAERQPVHHHAGSWERFN